VTFRQQYQKETVSGHVKDCFRAPGARPVQQGIEGIGTGKLSEDVNQARYERGNQELLGRKRKTKMTTNLPPGHRPQRERKDTIMKGHHILYLTKK